MKKIILLETLLTAAIIMLVLLLGVGIYASSRLNYPAEYIWFAVAVQAVLAAALFLARRGLSSFVQQGIFNKRSASSFKYSGWLLIFFAVLCGIGDFIFTAISKETIEDFIVYSIIILSGLGLIILADIIGKGEDMEQENKLTI